MRTLRLKSPRMTGEDVEAWQGFLIGKSFLAAGEDDGIFGQDTSDATREYQAGAGLEVDGVVGPVTFHQAVVDGFGPASGPAHLGMDTNRSCQAFAGCIAAAGKTFAGRYYSQFPVKNLTPAEARTLSAAGLSLIVVYEDSNDRIGVFTAARGAADAGRALAQAASIGQPAGSAIYFACDFDPTAAEVRGPVTEYFRAVNAAFTAAGGPYRVGIYGSGVACRIVRDAGLAVLTWLTGSTGFGEFSQFRPQADILQILPEVTICGGALEIDQNVAQREDIGAFQVS